MIILWPYQQRGSMNPGSSWSSTLVQPEIVQQLLDEQISTIGLLTLVILWPFI